MDVLFAPDWRQGVPYQQLLANALTTAGVQVSFLSHYKRLLPLTRLLRERSTDLLHLHWPEAYYPLAGFHCEDREPFINRFLPRL